MKDFPWGIMIASIAIVFFWLEVFNINVPDEAIKFVLSCWASGAVSGIISGLMKIHEDKNGK